MSTEAQKPPTAFSLLREGSMGELKVVAYLRATKDEQPVWAEDCVCEDPVYPTDPDGSDEDCISMPVVRLSEAEQALQALREEVEGLRRDSERLEWVMHRLSRKELRRIGIETSSGGPYWTRIAIDAAIRNGGEG
jgi:hypothetical protein